MRLKDTKIVKAMIDRMNARPGPTPGGNPFPQEPGIETSAYIQNGQRITIDLKKLKTYLLSQGADLSVQFTPSDYEGIPGYLIVGTELSQEEYPEPMIDLVGSVGDEEKASMYSEYFFGDVLGDLIEADYGMAAAEALDLYDKMEVDIFGVDTDFYLNFGIVAIIDVTEEQQVFEIPPEELAKFITFASSPSITVEDGKTLTINFTTFKNTLTSAGIDLTDEIIAEGGQVGGILMAENEVGENLFVEASYASGVGTIKVELSVDSQTVATDSVTTGSAPITFADAFDALGSITLGITDLEPTTLFAGTVRIVGAGEVGTNVMMSSADVAGYLTVTPTSE